MKFKQTPRLKEWGFSLEWEVRRCTASLSFRFLIHFTMWYCCPSWEVVWIFPGVTYQVSSKCGMVSIPSSADPLPVWTQPIWTFLITGSSLQGSTCFRLCTLTTPETGLLCLLSPYLMVCSYGLESLVFKATSRNRKTEPFLTMYYMQVFRCDSGKHPIWT